MTADVVYPSCLCYSFLRRALRSVDIMLCANYETVTNRLQKCYKAYLSGQLDEKRHPATTSTRRFPANQIPTLRFHALLNEEAPQVELMLALNYALAVG
jgi:hypothetical protein